jgi:Cd2+/Zn2+-exporting ATPase
MMAVGEWMQLHRPAPITPSDLAKLPPTVTVRRAGQENVIPVEQVLLGDIVLVRTGERIGVDGEVIGGNGSVNQSAITGESMPVEKRAGDEVFAGTLNELGAMEITVTRLGQDTTLGQIVRLVKDAQATQAPVQRVANKYAKVLVPVTFGIAILVYILTGDILRSITVLVVVCPCALVLATPTAVVASIGNAARRGMLVKTGAVVEQGKVNGQIRQDRHAPLGKPSVKEVISTDSVSQALWPAPPCGAPASTPSVRLWWRSAFNAAWLVSPGISVLPGFYLPRWMDKTSSVTAHCWSRMGCLVAELTNKWPR